MVSGALPRATTGHANYGHSYQPVRADHASGPLLERAQTDLLPNCLTTQASVDEDLKILSQLTTRLRMYSA
jgi:hypothetical protein